MVKIHLVCPKNSIFKDYKSIRKLCSTYFLLWESYWAIRNTCCSISGSCDNCDSYISKKSRTVQFPLSHSLGNGNKKLCYRDKPEALITLATFIILPFQQQQCVLLISFKFRICLITSESCMNSRTFWN